MATDAEEAMGVAASGDVQFAQYSANVICLDEDPPFKRAETETVSVEVKSVLPTSDRTYEVEWVETTRDLYGTVKATDRWKGYFAIALNPPKDERQARINPLGVYITNASWAKVL